MSASATVSSYLSNSALMQPTSYILAEVFISVSCRLVMPDSMCRVSKLERLKSMEHFSLENRQLGGGGLIEVYKIMHRVEEVGRERASPLFHNRNQGHSMKLLSNRFKPDKRNASSTRKRNFGIRNLCPWAYKVPKRGQKKKKDWQGGEMILIQLSYPCAFHIHFLVRIKWEWSCANKAECVAASAIHPCGRS